MYINEVKFIKDLFKALADNGIFPEGHNSDDGLGDDIGNIISSRKTVKTRTVSTYNSSTTDIASSYPDPHIIVEDRDLTAYALVSKSGYTVCTDADTFERQSGFFSTNGLVWKGFDCVEDAMEWIADEAPKRSPFKNFQLASPEYLFAKGGFWYKSGFKCDPEEIEKWMYRK